VQEGVGDLVISANPLAGSSAIDPEIVAALEDVTSHPTRLGAVTELTIQIGEATPLTAGAVRRLLQRRLQIERDYIVRRAIESALAETGARPPQAVPQASPERSTAVATRSSALAAQQEDGLPAQQGDSQLPDLRVFRDGPFAPELVVIPAGPFMVGSPQGEEERFDERPQHRVTIGQRFAIGRYPVTFNEYDRFCEAKRRKPPEDKGWGRGRRPVINVSWNDAQAYIAWLSQETGRTYRLPSEAEWEYACRAGTTTRYSFGDMITPENANHLDSGLSRTSEVGAYPANPWGLHDMHGNVWEWAEDDWHENYRGAPADGSAWKDAGAGRNPRRCVLRGGSWHLDFEWRPVLLPQQGRLPHPCHRCRVPGGPNTFLIPES
jgi:formylglycine-generating enzyme required for sulfatase activity